MLSDLERNHLGIDPATLEEELMIQSDVRGQYAENESEAAEDEANLKLAAEKAKEMLFRKEGSLRLFISKKVNWQSDFEKAPTKDLTDAWVHNNAEYTELYDDYILQRERQIRASALVSHAHGMVSSMDSKKKSLELLVSLYNGGYWADPKTDGGIAGGKRNMDIGAVKEDQDIVEAKEARREGQRAKRKATVPETEAAPEPSAEAPVAKKPRPRRKAAR